MRSDNGLYHEDLSYLCSLPLPWEKLEESTVLIAGATGMIGTFLIDALMQKHIGIRILALSRSEEKAKKRFACYLGRPDFQIIECDLNKTSPSVEGPVDYIVHAASNTHPHIYAADPIGTIRTNILGTDRLLSLGAQKHIRRFLFCSSVEIYGENTGECAFFSESDLGYIDSNTLRAGYPESKRAGEALCQAYLAQAGVDVVLPRLPRTYGPTLLSSDSKALSQFLRKGIEGENIVLKSEGTQFFSYAYVADAAAALLYCLLLGESGQAYNIADEKSNVTLRDLAGMIASCAGTRVVFELPDELERAGYSTATRAVMNAGRIRESLGWRAHYSMEEGLKRTMQIRREEAANFGA